MDERHQASIDRENLLSQITSLVNASGAAQDQRMRTKVEAIRKDMTTATAELKVADKTFNDSMDTWSKKESQAVEEVLKSRETLKSKLKRDWTSVNDHNTSIQTATKSVHEETVRIVDAQMKDMAAQMQALDDFVTRARSQNENHHTLHVQSLQGLAQSVNQAYAGQQTHLATAAERVRAHDAEMGERNVTLSHTLQPLDEIVCRPLSELRERVLEAPLSEYAPTGETPQKIQYFYPNTLPRTEPHDVLLARAHSRPDLPDLPEAPPSPSKSLVFADAPEDVVLIRPSSMDGGLREVHININAAIPRHSEPGAVFAKTEVENVSLSSSLMGPPPLKRQATMDSKLPLTRAGKGGVRIEGRENVAPSVGGGGRRLRSSPTG